MSTSSPDETTAAEPAPSLPRSEPSSSHAPISPEEQARVKAHQNQTRFSQRLLVEAREKAHSKWGYDYVATRKMMLDECRRRSKNSITPHTWQLDIAEALFLGIDCELIAGTGSGKTLPMVLQHFIKRKGPGKVSIIVSPLNVLEEDQVRRCRCFFLHSEIDQLVIRLNVSVLWIYQR